MTTHTYHSLQSQHHCRPSDKKSRLILGGIIIIIGGILLAKRLGFWIYPFHIWPLILLGIGIYSGVKNNFRNIGSWVLIILGTIFLLPKFVILGVTSTKLAAPALLIAAGVYIILKPHRSYKSNRLKTITASTEDEINIDISFGERASAITSKKFKGGIINNTFGEVKLNLLEADSAEPVILDMHVSFGAVEILIPSHWDVDFQVANNFASVEDKRYLRLIENEQKKTLTITGFCSFGSISIKSV